MEVKSAIFLDKDGTLIPDIPYNVDPEQITLSDGVVKGLRLLQRDYLLFVVSNQSGVAKGFFEMEALEQVKKKLIDLLQMHYIKISGFYFCPHDPKGVVSPYAVECKCRKPKSGMLLQAAAEHQVDLSTSWMIGDILNDVQAGKAAGCKTILINNGNETEWDMQSSLLRKPEFIAANFLQATAFISLNQNRYVRERNHYIQKV